jgi:hypothetical protein
MLAVGLLLTSITIAALTANAVLRPPWDATLVVYRTTADWCRLLGMLSAPVAAAVLALAAPRGRLGRRLDRAVAIAATVLFVLFCVVLIRAATL